MKILSPVGDMESLKVAVFNGANEVYLGVKDFNARNNIQGFSLDELKTAVDFCHLYDVKVNLTVNILFDNQEVQDALDLIVDAYNIGVDYFIIQDIGLISMVRKLYPQVVIHASTQMGIHNLEGVRLLESLGVSRVVLSRETPLEEIKRIRQNTNMEIEYFVQGALCVCFSGNCYLSEKLCDASGNRGKCKQLCRLPYTLRKDGKDIKTGYLLSAKDFNMLDRLQDLQDAGVQVIKIEGRARRPYYVGEATRTYYNAINNIEYKNNLDVAFNRGYTQGYFNGNGNIISNYSGHIGRPIGKIVKVNKGKRFNEIKIMLYDNFDLAKKSAFKFFRDDKEVAVVTAYDLKINGKSCSITTTNAELKRDDLVNLISEPNMEQEVLTKTFKRKQKIKVTAIAGQSIIAEFEVKNKQYKVMGAECLVAQKCPLSEQEIVDNFQKDEYFESEINTELDNAFLPKQKLNEFRRKVFEKLYQICTENNIKPLVKQEIEPTKQVEFEDFEFVSNINAKTTAHNIVYEPSEYILSDIQNFIKVVREQNKKPYLSLPIFALEQDICLIKEIVKTTHIAIVANNAWALTLDTEIVIGSGLNVYNDYSAVFFGKAYIPYDNHIYRKPLMTFRHCPMKNHLNATCANCPYKDGYDYVLDNGKLMHLKRIKMSTCTFTLN